MYGAQVADQHMVIYKLIRQPTQVGFAITSRALQRDGVAGFFC